MHGNRLHPSYPSLGIAACLILFSAAHLHAQTDVFWGQWRGNQQNGVAPAGDYPVQWSSESNIAWTLDLPGRGGSTPVIVGDTAYLTAGFEDKNHVIAVNLTDGTVAWTRELGDDRGGKHQKGSGSNPSVVSDGKSLFAYFRSGDVGCLSADGTVRWHHNLQDMYGQDTLWWDLGSSPIIADGKVIIPVMHSSEGEDRRSLTSVGYVVALNAESGDVAWKVDRNTDAPVEASQSYTTPVRCNVNGIDMFAVLGADQASLHRVNDGMTVGTVGGFNPAGEAFFRSISSPAVTDGVLICPYSRGDTVTAIALDRLAKNAGRDAVIWERDDIGSDVPTPAVENGVAYFIEDGRQNRGEVIAVDVKTGETKWTVATPKSRVTFSSSPLIAGDHLYVTAEDSQTYVIGPLSSDSPELVAQNDLGEQPGITVSSPVPLKNGLLIRTRDSLIRVGK
ncbi:PQQ-binding-like beta-propeller repeat protein [Crateriforma conspicua]|uniref:Outer membrane biogenesis protein BamB n=1 Tax=Crateriforma conspicua TaxID=2527996 RepID=A0A5C6FQE2_9PLAN|nr:PQQ-binding-like beta-propeller repeat protein [Crateriforma conspicua]TWU65362.1 outer membrane biogenesis protein BamB [Crateriforma conspicua]